MDLTNVTNTKKDLTISHMDEDAIRKLSENFEDALTKRDIVKLMSFYSPKIVAFDFIGPLQFIGIEAYRKSWEDAFNLCASDKKLINQVSQLEIKAKDNIAFSHCLIHHEITPKNGTKMNTWMRCTRTYEKTNGKWLITHEQYSLPVDLKTGKAILDLKPESRHH